MNKKTIYLLLATLASFTTSATYAQTQNQKIEKDIEIANKIYSKHKHAVISVVDYHQTGLPTAVNHDLIKNKNIPKSV